MPNASFENLDNKTEINVCDHSKFMHESSASVVIESIQSKITNSVLSSSAV